MALNKKALIGEISRMVSTLLKSMSVSRSWDVVDVYVYVCV